MSQFKKVEYKTKIHYNPPFINDDPLVVDKGNPHFNHDGKKDFIQSIESYKYENGTLTFLYHFIFTKCYNIIKQICEQLGGNSNVQLIF